MSNLYSEVRDQIEEELWKLSALRDLISVCHNPQELGAGPLEGLALIIDDVHNGIADACVPLYRQPEKTIA